MNLHHGRDAATQLLGLEGWEVVDVREDSGRGVRQWVVVPTTAVGLCPQCHRATDQRHQTRERAVRDLPMGAYATELLVRLPQYQCPACGKLFTPHSPALAESAHATERFLERLAQMLRWGDLKNAAGFFGVAEKTLERWYYDYLERRASAAGAGARQPIRSLGIDELARKKNAAGSAAC